ncbi:hypothetical protein, partial [Mesorhizobium sp. M1A.F.Ca.IN.020.06.1.1]|uniref:hypothetical protein n=1 Tax=Mesorhizobium sp. M1A.F.Ca.IN.020.06.1.1 TaxID=2496765 RepID=UPI0019D48657
LQMHVETSIPAAIGHLPPRNLPDRGSAAEVSRVQRKFDRRVPTALALLRENQSGGSRPASGCIGGRENQTMQ